MKTYATKAALQTIVENFRKPWQLFVYHPLKFEIAGKFPATKTTVFSRKINGTTYYLAHSENKLNRNKQFLTHDGKFRETDFMRFFDDYARQIRIFESGQMPVTIGENIYTDAILKYMKSKGIDFEIETRPMHFFAMNQRQMFKNRNFEFGTLPNGYSFDTPNTSEVAISMHENYSYADGCGIDYIKEKLERFPSLCVRKGDRLAGFISLEPNGALSNLLVYDEHRGKNLGEQLETGASKLAIEAGIIPTKFIDQNNDFYLNKTKKSKLMDIVEQNGKPIIVDYNVIKTTKPFNL